MDGGTGMNHFAKLKKLQDVSQSPNKYLQYTQPIIQGDEFEPFLEEDESDASLEFKNKDHNSDHNLDNNLHNNLRPTLSQTVSSRSKKDDVAEVTSKSICTQRLGAEHIPLKQVPKREYGDFPIDSIEDNMLRGVYNLTGVIGAGAYLGAVKGLFVGATLGSAIPAVGAVIGAISGIILGGIFGSLLGTVVAKLTVIANRGATNKFRNIYDDRDYTYDEDRLNNYIENKPVVKVDHGTQVDLTNQQNLSHKKHRKHKKNDDHRSSSTAKLLNSPIAGSGNSNDHAGDTVTSKKNGSLKVGNHPSDVRKLYSNNLFSSNHIAALNHKAEKRMIDKNTETDADDTVTTTYRRSFA